MSFLNRLQPGHAAIATGTAADGVATATDADNKVAMSAVNPGIEAQADFADETAPNKPDADILPNQDAQLGVRKIEAVTLSWTKISLAALLIKYVESHLPPLRSVIPKS
jgi:hypothetical protein